MGSNPRKVNSDGSNKVFLLTRVQTPRPQSGIMMWSSNRHKNPLQPRCLFPRWAMEYLIGTVTPWMVLLQSKGASQNLRRVVPEPQSKSLTLSPICAERNFTPPPPTSTPNGQVVKTLDRLKMHLVIGQFQQLPLKMGRGEYGVIITKYVTRSGYMSTWDVKSD